MKSISFDNPYLLLLFIPLALAIIIPYVISVSRDNKTAGWKISLGIHIAIAAIATLAAAGIMSVTVLTRTTVYVVADVSYSSEKSLTEIDERIAEIKASLPQNSRLGVICFGKNSIQHTMAGRAVKSVKTAKVDKSGTDIAGALNYAGTLFSGDEIKRIILITDGNDTINKDASAITGAVDRLVENGVKIDAIFIDNTVSDDEYELQLSGADFTPSTYIGHENEAKFLVQSSRDANVYLELFAREHGSGNEYEKLSQTASAIQSGLSTVTMSLPTDTAGTFDYKAVISTDADLSKYNNEITFSQTVEGELRVLAISESYADISAISTMYSGSVDIDHYIVNQPNSSVPFKLEELAAYDEFILSNVDIRNFNNVGAFVDSLDTVISQYGKSLITIGDLKIQEEASDPIFDKFEELLPVKYGNSGRDGSLYTIVLDVSHSINMASKYALAKESAIRLISLLNDDDYVCLITFSGKVTVRAPALVKDAKSELIEYIEGLSTGHGTDIAMGLEEALRVVGSLGLTENRVMLITDGKSFASERSAAEVAKELFDAGVPVSAIHVMAANFANKENSDDYINGHDILAGVVSAGEGGTLYEVMTGSDNANDAAFGTVSNEITEAIVTKVSSVNIIKYKDDITKRLTSVPDVSGYIQSVAKFDATVPLTINYERRPGSVVQIPLYAYRSHGNGRVVSLTTSLSGTFTELWDRDTKSRFVENMLVSCTPDEKVDYPFTVELELDEFGASVGVTPSELNSDGSVMLKITYPGGAVRERELTFDSQKYFTDIACTETGSYELEITYSHDGKSFVTTKIFDVPYFSEYNAFATFDKANIYSFIHGNGAITEGEAPSLENDESEISTYKVRYTVPLLIIAIILFVADIVIRKLRINKKIGKKLSRELGRVKVKEDETV
ncbi:MAG: VWA domain-containing protein [Clostridia bacterium]|nr:VWA domain-containing protein [Clostridia bacterium]